MRDDPLLRSARREAAVAALIWLAAAIYSISYCAAYGYDIPPDQLTFTFGIPTWVFWGVVVPWCVCTVIAILFATFFVRDDPLGAEARLDPETNDLPIDAPPAQGAAP